MANLTVKAMMELNEVFKRLNILRRWTSLVTENKYNEMAKQALNCATAYILASFAENAGHLIKWERFPKIAVYRAFQKVYVYFDTPEHIINDICKSGDIKKDAFNEATEQIILEKTGEDFANFICEGLGTYEMRIYRAATKIATYIELTENETKISSQEFAVRSQQILKSLEEFDDIPGISEVSDVEGNIFKVLKRISKLRNSNRWAAQAYTMECSVLGHLFDTAVFAYCMSLEDKPNDEEVAAQMFFMGIFHDVAEAWTTDVPSPIKDRIPGFRKATEEYELKVLDEKLYARVPEFLSKQLKAVMFEDASNAQYKKLLKGADYLSADSECWRQYVSGTRDSYFLGAILRRKEGIETGKVLLPTPVCAAMHEFYKETILSVNYDLKLAEFMHKKHKMLSDADWAEFEKEFEEYIRKL